MMAIGTEIERFGAEPHLVKHSGARPACAPSPGGRSGRMMATGTEIERFGAERHKRRSAAQCAYRPLACRL